MNGQALNHKSGITQPAVARPIQPTKTPAAFNVGASHPQMGVQRAMSPFAPQPQRAQTTAVLSSRPPAPPVYRPQAAVQRAVLPVARPPLLPTKAVSSVGSRPPAPPVYRPQAAVQRAVSPVAHPMAQRQQTFPVFSSRPSVPAPFKVTPGGSPLGQQRPGLVAPQHRHQFAIQPFAPHLRNPQHAISQLHNPAFLAGGVVQPYGQVIQPSWFWDYAGYITDAISSATTISGIISALVVASGATGWGWLVPLILPAVGTLINTLIGIRAKRTNNEDKLGQKDAEWVDWMNALVPFIQTVVAAVFGLGIAQSDNATLKWVASAITSLLLIAAEALRVNFGITRESLYRNVYEKVKSCCPSCNRGEQTALLGN